MAARVRRLRERTPLVALGQVLLRGLLGARPSAQLAWLPVAVLLVASAVIFILPGGGSLIAQDFDLLLLFVASSTAALTVAVLREHGPVARLKGLLLALLLQVPLVLALVAAVVMTGSLRGGDAVRGQGFLPWEWNAFRSPSGFALVIAWLATQIALGAHRQSREGSLPRGGFGADTAERVALLLWTVAQQGASPAA